MSRRTEDLKANIWQCSHSFAGEKQERGNFSPEGEGRERKGRGVEREKIIHVIHEAISDWDGIRLQRCIATINRWTDYCNNREIIVSDYWLSQKHRKIIDPDG